MAHSNFFNNENGNTLFEKLKGISDGMGANFKEFFAVSGYFRSSGYFKLREYLDTTNKIRILVGINVDDIFHKHSQALLMLGNEDEAKQLYSEDFLKDVKDAKYSKEIEDGILQMFDDLKDGRLELRIHQSKNLHAKFYMCLPDPFNENTDGWVIMGSSNLTDSGLGKSEPQRYELNVAMKDYDDVSYCKEEFEKLWKEGVEITPKDVERDIKKTYLGVSPTPYEIFIKVLIDVFGEQVEDNFDIALPSTVKDLKYQKDAVIEGYQMLKRNNGLFLADVVGLGKTLIATMIAKRFIEENGRKYTNVLVIYPPSVEKNWKKAFEDFGINKNVQFVSNGSLHKVIEGSDNLRRPDEFDMVIVDEAHGFRNDKSMGYDSLQVICKSPRPDNGFVKGTRKKVMLLSATPLNNRPEDLKNELLLFQDSHACTIDGISDLDKFFAPLIKRYKDAMKQAKQENKEFNETDFTYSKQETGKKSSGWLNEVDKIYETIRSQLMEKVTIRRTRHNIENDEEYRKDLADQDIVFPKIEPPIALQYDLGSKFSPLFYETLSVLSNDSDSRKLNYARYRAIEFLTDKQKENYDNAEQISRVLAGVYRGHMVKRLESSFYAFKRSLDTMLRITSDMIKMWNEDKIIIAPELKVKELQAQGMEIDEIIEYAAKKGLDTSEIVHSRDHFRKDEHGDYEYIKLLEHDETQLKALKGKWDALGDKDDPKFDTFLKQMPKMMDKCNVEGKLVIFSESVDTINYLYARITKDLKRSDVMEVCSTNRSSKMDAICANFDANYPVDSQEKTHPINILLTSDALAEGVNLHRSNVIINYDSPWNASRLMQRIGRVNRIGSTAGEIFNYMFYPSAEGNEEINLYQNALVKLQGFHSAFGEDSQVYSVQEIVHNFELFDKNVRDKMDRRIELLRIVRKVFNHDRALYDKIKALPPKSRCARKAPKPSNADTSVIFVQSKVKTEFYRIANDKVEQIDFLDAVDLLEAKATEKPLGIKKGSNNYVHVEKALNCFRSDHIAQTEEVSITVHDNRDDAVAIKILRDFKRNYADMAEVCDALRRIVESGKYNQVAGALKKLPKETIKSSDANKAEQIIRERLFALRDRYDSTDSDKAIEWGDPEVVISETFV